MATDPVSELTHDAFLGGKVLLWQRKSGYRAGIDAVLLAAAINARHGHSVLELGCGVGAVSLCLKARISGLHVTGIEREPVYADLAEKNGLNVVQADFTDLPFELRMQSFDHVMANPPYFDRNRGAAAPNALREQAMGEDTPLGQWVEIAAKRLFDKGYLHMIHRAERLAEMLAAIQLRFGSIEIWPILPRGHKPAQLVLLRARKSGRAPLILHSPIILHEGPEHGSDRPDYTVHIENVLRHGHALV